MIETQRQQQKIQTRKNLIDVAMNQFAKDGLTATRTIDVAVSAGVSHGTVFAHFLTRETLLDAVIEEYGMRIAARMNELVDKNCGIKELLEAHLQGIKEFEPFYVRLAQEGHLLHGSARTAMIMIQSAISFQMVQVAEREMAEKKIRATPMDLLFNTWIGLVHYYLINRDQFAPDGSIIEQFGDKLLSYFLNLILLRGD